MVDNYFTSVFSHHWHLVQNDYNSELSGDLVFKHDFMRYIRAKAMF